MGQTENNILGDNFTGNETGINFNRNVFGIEAVENTIGENFEDNRIENYFLFNTIGNDFFKNRIDTWFECNEVDFNFAFNEIGHHFYNNVIRLDFGFGGGQSYGNKIGNYFGNNTIGEYFYSNIITDLFNSNVIANYFRFNDVKVHNFNGYNLLGNYQQILDFSYDASASIAGTDGVYVGLTHTKGNGDGASFDVTVASSLVTSVVLGGTGYGYQIGDNLTVPYQTFGGTFGSDLVLVVGSVSGTPPVYGDYNCDIFRVSSGDSRLSYFDENDVLNVTNIS